MQAASFVSSKGAAALGGVVKPSQLKVLPVVAALLSVLLVELGQMLNGQVSRSLAMLGASLVIGLILTLTVVGAVLRRELCAYVQPAGGEHAAGVCAKKKADTRRLCAARYRCEGHRHCAGLRL